MDKKWYQVSGIITLCILINYIGRVLTSMVTVPLWLDSIGTALSAYLLGPVCGAIVGAVVNIVYGMNDPVSLYYALTNICAGIVIGICAKHGMLDEFFKLITTCTLVTVTSTVISAPLNCILYGGATGNIWGDGIFELLKLWGLPVNISAVIAEFFLDFLDKFVCLFIVYLIINIHRKKIRSDKFKNGAGIIAVIILTGALICGIPSQDVYAAEKGQYSSYIQTVYSNDNGLMSGEANDIAATDDGILWIGTYAGLYRYSGNEFKYLNQFESVKNVNCLYVDVEGRLWIGTNDDGLSSCIEEEVANNLNEAKGLPSNSVRSIVQCSNGEYFVGTASSLAILKLSGGLKITKSFPEIVYASCLSADKSDNVAAVTALGELFIINGEEIVSKNTISKDGENYSCCYFGRNGLLYVGTDAGQVYVYEISKDKLKRKSVIDVKNLSTINKINQVDKNTFFVCGDNGIAYFNTDEKVTYLSTSNFSSSIDSMTVDYQGNLWFSSSRLGVMKLCSSPFSEIYKEANLEEKVVNSVSKWKGRLYFGTDNGLDVIDADSKVAVSDRLAKMFENDRIRCTMVDSDYNLWICSYGNGVVCVNPDGKTTAYDSSKGTIGSKFRNVVELGTGKVAVGSELGVSIIEDGSVANTIGAEDGLENTLVLCMLQLDDGRLLAGTDGGGIAVIKDNKVASILTRNNGLGSGVILRMVKEENGEGVFIITSNGICYMDGKGVIRELDQFPYSNNFDLYDNGKGKLFVTGSAGIYIADKEKLLGGKKADYELLNYLNGLRGTFTANAWNYMDESGKWYICGSSGVTELNVNTYQKGARSYRMIVKSVVVDDTTHYLNGEKYITIPSGASHISVLPEIVNYSTEDPYVSYYIEGIDSEKTILRQSELSTINYNNLPSGSYEFHLSILDMDKETVKEEQIYTIIKEAEIYDHLWFKILFFLELIVIIAWITWFITRTFIQRTVDLQRRELALAKEQISMGNETILAIARTVDAKDSNTSHHSERVSHYSVLIAEKLGYSKEDRENLRKAALMHDIGKIGIPDSVLNKPARLTDEEYEIMKSHVERGGEILKDFSLIPNVQDGAMYHHERFDGRGYPRGLKGEEIPPWARIIGIADAFDAMTANRVYRKKLDFDYVLGELERGRGTQFEPLLVDIVFELIEEGKIDKNELYSREEQE